MNAPGKDGKPLYDRALLSHGAMRNKVLTLEEVGQYGIDSFSDPDYVRIYGMAPSRWYGRGIRLLGRTAVECTRDALGNCIGRDIASIAARLPKTTHFTVIDPFAGSCNTLYWILRYVPNSQGLACEFDRQVYELTKRNIAGLDRTIDLQYGDYQLRLDWRGLTVEVLGSYDNLLLPSSLLTDLALPARIELEVHRLQIRHRQRFGRPPAHLGVLVLKGVDQGRHRGFRLCSDPEQDRGDTPPHNGVRVLECVA